MMKLFVLISTLFQLCNAASFTCKTPADCSYNGECDNSTTNCTCDPGWTGKTCSTLHLLPARRNNGLNTTDASGLTSSWGGTTNKGNDEKWHMHAAAFTHHCGINQWSSNSRIVHAVSDTPDGPYLVKDIVVPVWAHNPAVVQSPDDGMWVMTYVANNTAQHPEWEAVCSPDGSRLLINSTRDPTGNQPPLQNNYMMTAKDINGPWSSPVQLDSIFDLVVAPFTQPSAPYPDRNTNLILSLGASGDMTGLWRRCCQPPPKYAPPGGGGASVIFQVHADDWRNIKTWRASPTSLFPDLKANGYEDPHIYADRRPNIFHAVFHNMIGGWHQPKYPNIQVGVHAFSDDGGYKWTETGVAFNTTVRYDDGSSINLIRRERPHIVVNQTTKFPMYLTSGVTYDLSETEPSSTIVQPVAH